MFNSCKVTKTIDLAIIFSTVVAIFSSSTSFAAEENIEEIEKIQVTGSRIKRSDIETASPVIIIDATQINASGVVSIDSLLQKLTVSSGVMTNPSINNGSGGNARVNLRGLGYERTLVLLNGRRMIASGTGAAASVDLNTIPVSMIMRIEILKDGASAVYGSDAVAGVVNIILKRDFEGFEFNIQSGISAQEDAKETSFDFTIGNAFNKGNLVLGVQYSNRGEAFQNDRDFSRCPIAEQVNPGSIQLYCGGSSYALGGHVWGDRNHGIEKGGLDPETGDAIYAIGDSGHYGHYIQDTADTAEVGDAMFAYFDKNMSEANLSGRGGSYHPFGDDDKYNYSETSYLFTPMERINLSMSASYEVSDDIIFFTETTYTKRWSEQQMAPQPIWNTDAWVYMPKSAGSVEDGYFMTDDLIPFAQPGEKLDYGRRMLDSGSREFSQVVDTVRVIMGLEGIFSNEWAWGLSYNKGRNDSVDTLDNLHNISAVNDAVLASVFDPFIQTSWKDNSILPFTYTEINSGGSEMDIVAATLTGDVMALPVGKLGFSAGYEHRTESAYFIPDSLKAQGLANDPRENPTAGSFSVNEVFVEFSVPLLAHTTLTKALDVSVAARYFDYSTFGNDNTWKLGVTWKVNNDLMLRGVSSTAYRAPTVDELYGGKSPSFEQIKHNATEQEQAQVTIGGNPLLTPEKADIITLGAVYEPNFFEGFSATIDYFDISIKNAIDTVNSNYIANQCLNRAGQKINIDTALCKSADISIDGTGLIRFNNGSQNSNAQATAGYDINLTYTFEALGLVWKTGIDTSIIKKFEKSDQDGLEIDYNGLITGGEGSYAKNKNNINLTATAEYWKAGYEIRLIGKMDSFSCLDTPDNCYAPKVDAMIYHDITGSYYVNDMIILSGGINNLLDQDPHYYTGYNDSNTDPYTYDVLGRYYFLKVSFKF